MAAPEPVPGWAGFNPGPPAYQQQEMARPITPDPAAAAAPAAAPVAAAPRPIPAEHQCIQVSSFYDVFGSPVIL